MKYLLATLIILGLALPASAATTKTGDRYTDRSYVRGGCSLTKDTVAHTATARCMRHAYAVLFYRLDPGYDSVTVDWHNRPGDLGEPYISYNPSNGLVTVLVSQYDVIVIERVSVS